jgi:hypothetical protein
MTTEPLDLLPHYVYEMRDPRDNSVFYVGKGTGSRLDTHHAGEENEKGERIRQIRKAGAKEVRIVIGRFRTEDEALAVESVLIKWTYGINLLTNLIHGYRHRLIRPHAEMVNRAYSEIPGIDQPRVINAVRNGQYTNEQRQKITHNLILEKLESLRDALRDHRDLRGLAISDPDLTVPQNPCLIINGLASNAVQLQVKMQLTGETVVLNLVPASSEKVDDFVRALTEIEKPYNIRKGNDFGGKYSQTHDFKKTGGGYPRGVPYDKVEAIVQLIQETRERLRREHRPDTLLTAPP